jgi:hypothetical protein
VLLPLGILFVSIAACALVLSFYDWPDLLEGLPWADQKAAAPFVIPSSPRAQSTGLPQPPAWTQNGQHVPPAAAPATQPLASQPIVATPPYETPAPEPPAQQAAAPAPPKAAPQPAPTEASAPAARPPSTVSAPPAEAELTQPPGQQASAGPPAPSAAPARAHDVRPTATAPATPLTQVARVAPEIITLLLRRGDEQFTIGDVSAARLLYQRAAEAGSAAGARLEARTYDAAFLPRSGSTILADRDAARLWYSRAAALGDVEAATRLKTLNGGR